MDLKRQALVALPIAIGCCVWNGWALGWKLGVVSAAFWLVWFAIVVGFLVRHISIPEFKERNEEGLPYITGNKLILDVLPWGTRLSLASLVATGITIVLTMVLNGQANQQASASVPVKNGVEAKSGVEAGSGMEAKLGTETSPTSPVAESMPAAPKQ